MATKIQLRRDTAADWTSGNPTLAAGEFAWESDTNRFKIGDGATAWTSLGYADTLSTLGDLSVVGSTLSSPSNADLTLTTSGTGDIVLDQITVHDNTISTNASNANLEINANGSGTVVLENLSVAGDGATVTGILDEDAMGSNSAVKLATQQSIKAYVDANSGSGAALTGSTNNTITTVTGANAIQGEANLTFDGSTLAVTGAGTFSTTLGVTGASTLDGVTITDNTISSNASNAQLEISANGTGRINIGNADFTDDPGDLWSNAYGGVSNVRNLAIHYEDLTHTAGTDGRAYVNAIQTSIKTDGADTTSSNARFRGLIINTALDLNGSSITHSSISRGAQGVNAESFITNTSADAGVLSTATGFIGYVYVAPVSGSGDVTVTNAIGCSANADFEAGNLASDKTLTVTNAYGFYFPGNSIYGGSATKTLTNTYGYYASSQSGSGGTNIWQFYDATSAGTNSNSRLGAIQLINQSSAPTNLANHSWIYALDDSASSEVYVRDEAGNATKISPHNKEGEWEYYSVNSVTGKTVRVNMEKMIKDIEKLTGKKYIENI